MTAPAAGSKRARSNRKLAWTQRRSSARCVRYTPSRTCRRAPRRSVATSSSLALRPGTLYGSPGLGPRPRISFSASSLHWSELATTKHARMKNAASFGKPRRGWVRLRHRSRSVRWAARRQHHQWLAKLDPAKAEFRVKFGVLRSAVGVRRPNLLCRQGYRGHCGRCGMPRAVVAR